MSFVSFLAYQFLKVLDLQFTVASLSNLICRFKESFQVMNSLSRVAAVKENESVSNAPVPLVRVQAKVVGVGWLWEGG